MTSLIRQDEKVLCKVQSISTDCHRHAAINKDHNSQQYIRARHAALTKTNHDLRAIFECHANKAVKGVRMTLKVVKCWGLCEQNEISSYSMNEDR